MPKQGYFTGFLLFLWAFAVAQEPYFRNFDVDDGLPSSTVYYVFEDKDGWIWLATEAGVSRFNGRTFENFTTLDGLSTDEVLTIHQDSRGRIWFLTWDGGPVYYHAGTIYNSHNDTSLAKLAKKYKLHSFTEDTAANVWIGTNKGKLLFIGHDGRTAEYDLSERLRQYTWIYYLWDGPDGKIHLATRKGVITINSMDDRLAYDIDTTIILSGIRPKMIPSGEVLFCDKHSLSVLDPEDHSVSRIELPQAINTQVIFTGSGHQNDIWMGSRNGAFRFGQGNLKDQHPDHFLAGKTITAICQDFEGGLWFSTDGDGVFYTPSVEVLSYNEAHGLADKNITMLREDHLGRIWIGSDRNRFSIFDHGPVPKTVRSRLSSGRGRINDMIVDRDHNIWLISDHSLMAIYQKDTLYFKNAGKTIAAMPNGDLVIGSFNEAYSIPADAIPVNSSGYKHSRGYPNLGRNRRQLIDERVQRFRLDEEGRLWIGSIHGLFEWTNGQLISWQDRHPALNTRIADMEWLAPGQLWIATRGMGMAILEGDSVKQLTIGEGLSSNSCNALFIDDKRHVWVATNRGVNYIVPGPGNSYMIRHVGTLDGLVSDDVNDIFVRNDTAWMGTSKGLTIMPGAFMNADTVPPGIYMTGISIAGQSLPQRSVYQLGPFERNFTISFGGISYQSLGQLSYQYMMEGLDSSWQTTASPFVNFRTIPPGRYLFKVKAINKKGVASLVPASIQLEKLPPVWQQWWFQVLAGIFVSGLIGWIIYGINRRTRNIERRRAAVRQKLAESRLTALRAQMNPHFISNALNSIQTFILKNKSTDAYDYLEKFAELMRGILQNSNQATITLAEEIKTLELYLELESLRFRQDFSYEIRLAPDLEPGSVRIPPLILQPFVENAIWHGLLPNEDKTGRLLLECAVRDQLLKIMIEDNGIGRQASRQIKSQYKKKNNAMGVEMTRERIELINGQKKNKLSVEFVDLTDDRGQPTGTRVNIYLSI